MDQPIAGGDRGRQLANRLVATLGERPFAPSAAQLAWVGADELVQGDAPGALARVVGGRYAGLLADHLFEGPASGEVAAAYFRIWLCARQAFLRNLETSEYGVAPNPGVPGWENEGGALLFGGASGRGAQPGESHAGSN
jgi:hypothetical protein